MHPGPGDFNIWRKIEVEPWAKWFAWHPVKIKGNRVWLRTIYRRRVANYSDMERWMYYEYGTLFDILHGSK